MINTLIALFSVLATALYPLGQFGRISFFNQQVNLYVYELFMGAAFLVLLIRYRFEPWRRVPFARFILYLFASLLVSYVISLPFYDAYANGVAFLYFIRLAFYLAYFVYMDRHLHAIRDGKAFITREIGFLLGALIVASWLQYFLYPNLRNLLYQGWDPHLYRVFAFYFEPYLAGAALGLGLLFAFFRGGFLKRFRYPVIACLIVLLMLTFSRTVYAAMLATSLLYLARSRKVRYFALIVLVFAALAYIIPKPEGAGVQLFRTFSVESRLKNAQEGLAMWTKAPLLGVGYNRIRYAKAKIGQAGEHEVSHAAASYHSSFVTMLVAGGVAGLIAFVLLLVQLGKISMPSAYYLVFLSVLSLGDNALLDTLILFVLMKLLLLERLSHPSSK